MKKTILLLTLLAIGFALFGLGVAHAQGTSPAPAGYGPLHDFIEKALAAKLGLTETQIEQEFALGKSMSQIALEHGIVAADLPTFLREVHQLALSEAVKAGVLSQAQADWMLQNAARYGYGYGCSYGYGYGAANGAGLRPFGGGFRMGRMGWSGHVATSGHVAMSGHVATCP